MENKIKKNVFVIAAPIVFAFALHLTTMILLVKAIPSSLLSIGFMIEYGVFEDYTGWKEVEIPTNSELKARVKIPEEWYFVVEDDKVHIRDSEGNLIATEVYHGYGRGEKNFNENLPPKMLDLDNYGFVLGGENPCFLYKITIDGLDLYALKMEIMSRTSTAPSIGRYTSMLIFEKDVDIEGLYPKIEKSFRYGGIIKDGKPDED